MLPSEGRWQRVHVTCCQLTRPSRVHRNLSLSLRGTLCFFSKFVGQPGSTGAWRSLKLLRPAFSRGTDWLALQVVVVRVVVKLVAQSNTRATGTYRC